MAHDQAVLISQEQWYHGLLPREDMKTMLKKNGDFLVRTSEPKVGEPRMFILSVMVRQELEESGIKHFVIREKDGKFIVEKSTHNSVKDLVNYHINTREPVTKVSMAILLNPITQQLWERRHENVELDKKLGEGAFGEVHSGRLRLTDGSVVPVAVKLAKIEALTKEQIKEVMHEARLLRNFDHPNVVKCYGVSAGQEPLMVIMELAEGSLDSYLKKKPQTNESKYEMMVQSAFGLEYIHKKEVLHRDIAARNCLYGNSLVKIADFGLSRNGTCYQMSLNKRVPIRWISPETLNSGLYTVKTDVFAFGILCWEIWNNGAEPYPGMTVAEVHQEVRKGYRMEMLECNPDVQALVVKKCWAGNPNDRPTMSDVVKILERIFNIKRSEVEQANNRGNGHFGGKRRGGFQKKKSESMAASTVSISKQEKTGKKKLKFNKMIAQHTWKPVNKKREPKPLR